MAGTGDFKVAVKLHADASQYTAEFTKAGQLAQTFASQLQSGGNQAASGLHTAATAAQALGTATASGTQQASSGLTQASTAAQTLGSTLQATTTQAAQAGLGMDGLTKSSRETTQSQQQSRAAGDALIAMLRDQVATAGKSTEELLRYRAAQSGVAAEAAPLILQLQNQRAAQEASAAAARQEEAALREASAAKQRATAAQDAFMSGLREQIAVSGKSTEELLRYRAAQSGVAAEAAPLILQLQNQRSAQETAAAAARQEEAALREASAAKQRAAVAQDQFLAGLREEIALRGKSTTEVLQYRAAQLGVSSEAAQSIRILDDANKKGAISAGQHAAAMRMLPAQMTDVVTSIASGMPIWMVAIQQGGQIKDSFGGAGAAARAMLGAITPLAAGLAIVAGAVGLTAAAYYQGSAEADKFRQVTTLNGNAAGVTTEALSRMSREIDGIYGTQSKAAEGLAVLAGSGKIARDNLVEFTAMAVKMEDLAGRSIEQTSKELEQLGTKPAEASAKLNESYNYLTPTIYRQIKALEDQGRSEEAAALAQKTYSDAMSARADKLEGELGYVERGWRGARDLAKEAWDAFLNIGRPTTVQSKAEKHIADLEARIADRKRRAAVDGDPAWDKGTEKLQQQLDNAKAFSQLTTSAEKAVADAIDRENTARQAGIDLQREASRLATDAVKKRNELAQAEAKWLPLTKAAANASAEEVKAAAEAAKDYAAVVAGIEKKYSKQGSGGISITDNQLAGLQSQLQAAQQYYQQLQTLGASASELNAGERESLKLSEQIERATNAKTRAKLEEAKAIADALGVQLRSNAELEDTFKAEKQQHDAMAKGTEAIIQRAKDQEAANAVVGKGRTAIEQMTLAELELQLAQSQGKKASAQQIADLESRIDAQKRWVAALGRADYKAVMANAEEMLRNAQELAKVYEDELSLSGLTSLEREKIVAARQVELKYAKAIDAVNKGTLGDAEKELALEKLKEARGIETAAAVAKAQQNYMAKADEEINKSLTDALMRGFESGKGFAENLADTVENMFNTMVLRPVISAMMAPVSGVINGVMQSGLNAVGLGSSGSGIGNMQNLLSTGKSIYETVTGQNTLLNSIGSWLGIGGASLAASGLGMTASSIGASVIGGGLGTSIGVGTAVPGVATGLGLQMGGGLGITAGSAGASAIGAGLGTSTAAGGAGAASASSGIGALWPLAAMAGMMASSKLYDAGFSDRDLKWNNPLNWASKLEAKLARAIGIDDKTANILFGAPLVSYLNTKLGLQATPHAGAGSEYSGGVAFGDRESAGRTVNAKNSYIESMQEPMDRLAMTVGSTFDALASTFGKQSGYYVGTGFTSDNNDPSAGYFQITNPDGENLERWTISRKDPHYAARGGMYSKNAQKGYEEYLKDVAVASLRGIADVVPAWAGDMANAVADSLGEATGNDAIQAFQAVVQQIAVVKSTFTTLGETIRGFAGISDDVQSALMSKLGGIDGVVQATSIFRDAYYSDAEKLSAAQAQVRDAMEGLGLNFDASLGNASKEQFRAAVEDALQSGKGELAAQLLSLSAVFSDTANASQQYLSSIDAIYDKQHLLWADLAAAEGDHALAAQRRYWVETAGMTQAQQAAYDYIAAIKQQVSAAQAASQALGQLSDTRWGMENELYGLQGKDGLVAERTREKELAAMLSDVEDEEKRKQIATAYDYNEALRVQIKQLAKAAQLSQELSAERVQLESELLGAMGDSAGQAAKTRAIATQGYSAAERAAWDYNEALRAQISSANAAASAIASLSNTGWGLENQLYTLQGKDDIVAARTREKELAELLVGVESDEKRKQITAAYDYNASLRAQIEAQRKANEAAQAQAQAARQLRDAWQSAADSIYDEVRRIRGLNSDTAAQSLSAAQAQLVIAQTQTRAGDIDAAKSLPELSRSLLSIAESTATSAIELRRIQGQTASSLFDTATAVSKQRGLKLPSFDVGTNYVPHDMIAQIHRGEMIVPAAFNPAGAGLLGGVDPQVSTLLARILAVLDDIQHETQASAVSNASIAKTLQRVLTPSRSALRIQQAATA